MFFFHLKKMMYFVVFFVVQMVKMFVLLLVSFVLLMSPYRWMMFAGSVRALRGDQPAYGWALMRQSIIQGSFAILYVMNSVINPIIFNFMADRFKFATAVFSNPYTYIN